MTPTLTAPPAIDERQNPSPTLSGASGQPVTNIEALLAQLPKFTDAEVGELEEVIAEDRSQRRTAAWAAR